jgi:hypothetical protein
MMKPAKMFRLSLLAMLPMAACGPAKTSQPAAASAASQTTVTSQGEPYDLHLGGGALTFCDSRGMRRVDLKTGQDAATAEVCPQKEEANTACSGLGLEIEVRSPQSEPDDVVDLGGSSFPMKGRVHDCAADGRVLAIATGSAVSLIDAARNVVIEVSREGADRVAVGGDWVAWADGAKIRAVPRN